MIRQSYSFDTQLLNTRLDEISEIDKLGYCMIGTSYKPIKFNIKKFLSNSLCQEGIEQIIKQYISLYCPWISITKKKYTIKFKDKNGLIILELDRNSKLILNFARQIITYRGIFIKDKYGQSITS